jgi:hypothetical protein
MHAAATSEMYLKRIGLACVVAARGVRIAYQLYHLFFVVLKKTIFKGGINEQYPRSCWKEPS